MERAKIVEDFDPSFMQYQCRNRGLEFFTSLLREGALPRAAGVPMCLKVALFCWSGGFIGYLGDKISLPIKGLIGSHRKVHAL